MCADLNELGANAIQALDRYYEYLDKWAISEALWVKNNQ